MRCIRAEWKCAAITAALLAVAGCGDYSSSNYGPDTNASAAGTWTGTLTVSEGSQSGPAPMTLVLTQSGTSVAGTFYPVSTGASGSGDPITGTVSGHNVSLHITASKDAQDDCDKYPFDIAATINGSSMGVTSVTGTDCEGDGHGGHTSLTTITGGTGTLTKQGGSSAVSYLRSPVTPRR